MKTKITLALSLILGLASIQTVSAHEAGTWLVRSRAIFIAPSVSNTTLTTVDVKTSATPEFDFSYFAAKDFSLELILGMARHQVNLGATYLGSLNVLPPTLTAQYHFKDILNTGFDPYLGAGLNYTFFIASNIDLVKTKSSSFGAAFQAGADIPIKGDIFLNLDIKKILMSTDLNLTAGGALADTLTINPWVYGLGVGFKI